ncbi:MAG: 1-acyl-sn-glycerol-3-phosphate acyltransferase [Desulfobacterales bacterium]|nr:1-acyl-sn-glycerol-3-phosphate acyltransferase [Desulfobacterales bacterium]
MIRTALIAIWVILITLLCALVVIYASFLKKGGNFPHLVARLWAKSILFMSRVKVSVQGLHHIDPRATYIYMANHQSMFDILALLGYLPVQFRWLAKMELFQIPVFGYSMARVGYISIDRSSRRSAHKSLQEAAQKIARGVSVVAFPEGTRSTDGQIKPFKAGGFYLAIRSGQAIVPVVIYGTRHVMPKGSLRIRPGCIIVSLNPPVDTASYNNKTKEVLIESVRSVMKQDLEKILASQPSGVG